MMSLDRFARAWLAMCVTAVFAGAAPARGGDFFQITVFDEQTGRGVPLVELETVNNIRYVSDSNGIVAFLEPGLMDREVFFHIRSHGYEAAKDGFGYRGKALRTTRGGSARVGLKRLNIAERLYRITGQGIYRDTALVGGRVPLAQGLLNGEVLGQDSVQALIYRGEIHWFWGDTNRARYPLGQFAMSGASSKLPDNGGLDPSVGVDLKYFVDQEGFSRKMSPTQEQGLMWLDGFLALTDGSGQECMVAHYARMKSLAEKLEHGLSRYNDRTDTFEKLKQLDLAQQWRCPQGHPLRVRENNEEYCLFPTPFPMVRVKANLKQVTDPVAYEAFTPLRPGAKYVKGATEVERDAAGRLVYGWKANAEPIDQRKERSLLAAGKLTKDEVRFQVRDVDSGKDVDMHSGSIYWNEYRRQYVMIAVEVGGASSLLGEVWFAESPSPTGPWRWARKIVTHDKYTFYNPKQHPFFDQKGGQILYFEGTYANTFSGNPVQTPRYDYNQIMYRLDLADPRLGLPLTGPKK
jgi:hypothetical protein